MRRTLCLIALTLTACLVAQAGAQPSAPVAFGLDWKAEAEYGGYYQAVATASMPGMGWRSRSGRVGRR